MIERGRELGVGVRGGARRAGSRRAASIVALSIWLLGCRTTQSTGQGASDERRADALAVRRPEDMPSPWTARPALGALETADTQARALRETSPPRRERASVPAPTPSRCAASAARRPYPLREGALVVRGGLSIGRVPRGVAIHTVREAQTGEQVWEITDVRGRRLALLTARSWSRAAASTRAPLLDETATVRVQGRRTDWSREPVRVVIDRFRSDTHIYVLERRAVGTDWIWSGLELVREAGK